LTSLFAGRLDQLTPGDLADLAQQNEAAAAHLGTVLPKLDRAAGSLSTATVPARYSQNLPSGSKTFIADWNRYLSSSSAAVLDVRRALTGLGPMYPELRRLVGAAYSTGRLRSNAAFDRLRAAALKDIGPRYQRLRSAVRSVAAVQAVESSLVKFVDGDQQAQAIVAKVNHDYPNGFLASEFRRTGG
jgi:hypothetical protein